MSEITITEAEEAKPEVRMNFTVYLHAADLDEAVARTASIRHAIEEALADEDNNLAEFTYTETRTAWADKFGNKIAAAQVFHGSV